MHRFPTPSIVRRCHFAALLFLLRCLLPVVGIPTLLWAMIAEEQVWFVTGLGVMVAFPVVILTQWIVAERVRCPLCLMPPLLERRCSKNHRAARLLGSYRLRVSLAALFSGVFRCPYCGEPTQMKARRRR